MAAPGRLLVKLIRGPGLRGLTEPLDDPSLALTRGVVLDTSPEADDDADESSLTEDCSSAGADVVRVRDLTLKEGRGLVSEGLLGALVLDCSSCFSSSAEGAAVVRALFLVAPIKIC